MSATLTSLAPSQKIYHGDPKCPRTVVIQISSSPIGVGANVFVGTDRATLDAAQPSVNQSISEGVGILDLNNSSDRLVLPNVKTDIYARANKYTDPNNTPIVVNADSF